MATRKRVDPGLNVRQKLTLFHNTGLNAEGALQLTDEEITFELLMQHGVRALHICTAGIKPTRLKTMGVTTADQLRRLGFDALHLVDALWCQDVNAAYGAQEVIKSFVQLPSDAVAVAGTEAIDTLGIGMGQLLEVCAGAPTEAMSVLQQNALEAPLRGVSVTTLLDTGLRAPQLRQLGLGLTSVQQMTAVSPHDILKLGFTFA